MASVEANMTALRRRLPLLNNRALLRDLTAWQEVIASRVIDRLREYPNELDGQRYIRTFRLQQSWSKSRSFETFGGLSITISNFVTDRQGRHYASLVQGNDQKPIHQGRWLRVDEAMQEERTAYRAGLIAILSAHGLR